MSLAFADAGGSDPGSVGFQPPQGVPRLFAASASGYSAHLRAFGPLDVARLTPSLRAALPASGLILFI